MTGLGDRLKAKWASEGTKVRPGVSNQWVEAIEAKSCVSHPMDLREFYSIVDGMDDGETDDQLFRLFPLNVVKPVTD
jgi:cell wall assembly regulator SMI1